MRIIAGKLKGHILHLPKDKNTRPLKDLVRESIFNLLIHSNKISLKIQKLNILDLYSGTGSFGLECISRDAEFVYFVENGKNVIEILKKNIEKLNVKSMTKIFFNDVFVFLKKENAFQCKFDLIFCDPPFADTNIELMLNLIFNKKILNKNGIIILHRNKNAIGNLPNYFQIIEERSYGVSKIIFGRFLS
jgi:16S rRNA (guanine966-N2)-methyltransferase